MLFVRLDYSVHFFFSKLVGAYTSLAGKNRGNKRFVACAFTKTGNDTMQLPAIGMTGSACKTYT